MLILKKSDDYHLNPILKITFIGQQELWQSFAYGKADIKANLNKGLDVSKILTYFILKRPEVGSIISLNNVSRKADIASKI